MVSRLESPITPTAAPSRRDAPLRAAPSTTRSEAPDADPDVRVSLSAAARRLTTSPTAPEDSSERGDDATSPAPSVPESTDHAVPSRSITAYGEATRPVLGERISIRI